MFTLKKLAPVIIGAAGSVLAVKSKGVKPTGPVLMGRGLYKTTPIVVTPPTTSPVNHKTPEKSRRP